MIRHNRRRRQDGAPPELLVDYWYSHAVGHVIEALRVCQGYDACDPTRHLGLVLNGASPIELAQCTPFVDRVFGVPYTSFGTPVGSPKAALRGIPRDWDYVLHHPSAADPDHDRFDGLRRYQAAAQHHFRARRLVGVAGREPPAYAPHQTLRLALPTPERDSARRELAGRRAIAVMPAGSGARYLYPSLTSWSLVLDVLTQRYPDAAVVFVGRTSSAGGRTTSGIDRTEVERLMASSSAPVDAFDRPILDQLAFVEAASVFVSPHTGFGFAAVAVGTPWLTLSGGDWHEHFFNGVPFYSVLPKGSGPVFMRGRTMPTIDADTDGDGRRAAVMSVGRIRADLEEIGTAAEMLIEGRRSYEDALADYFPRILDAYGGDRSLVGAFDDLDRAYL